MQINEAIRNLEIAGYMVVDENHHSLDNMARLIKETYGISAKVNQEKIYFDYDEVAVEIEKDYDNDSKNYKITILDEATNKSIYQDIR